MTWRVIPCVFVLTALAVGVLASPAAAATSQGCSGSLASTTGSGAPLDSVAVPGTSGTTAHPFRLLWGTPTTWQGQSALPVTTGTWHVAVQNPSWIFALGQLVSGHQHGLSGTFATGGGGTTFTNSFTPSDTEPITLPGKYDVAFSVLGDGGVQCTGTISVAVVDSPFRNPIFWLAALLLLAGLTMLFFFGITKLTRPVYVRDTGREGF